MTMIESLRPSGINQPLPRQTAGYRSIDFIDDTAASCGEMKLPAAELRGILLIKS